ncbi:MAG: hypothetical protein RL026_1926 [Pseudomonadota bacterium]
MLRRWFVTAFTAFVVVLLLPAATAAQPLQVKPPQLGVETYTLPNGLTVILAEDKRLPLVAVNLWYHVGPAHEKPGRTGFAHLFEHMMFQSSKHVPEDQFFKLLEGAGATLINGSTSFDRTNYYETVPTDKLELALWLESDRMGFLLDKLDAKSLANQRDVVRNERRQSTEGRPYGLVDEAFYQTLFPKGHPYHGVVIGSHADIEAARLADVQEFFSQYYAPNNASLAIVGDIDKAAVKALVAKYFGSIKAGDPVPRPQVDRPVLKGEQRKVVTDRIELPRVTIGWFSPAAYAAGDAEADLLADLLAGDKSSRLYRRLVHELQIAQSVQATQDSLLLGSVFAIEATARPGVKPEQLEQVIDEELRKLLAEGPTQAEVDRARNGRLTAMLRSLETVGGVADRLNHYLFFRQQPDFIAADMARYQNASVASVHTLARDVLKADARAVVHAVPGEKVITDPPRSADAGAAEDKPATGLRVAAAEDWRYQAPKAGTPGKLALPAPRRFTLPNGLTVLHLEQRRLPVVAAQLVVLAGSDRNPVERPGLASFTADMLDEGTTTRDSRKLAEDIAALGASLGAGSTVDYSQASLYTLSANADTAFDLLADVVRRPSFPADEIERVRSSRLTQLMQQKDNPNALAQRVFNQALYGSAHPYGYTELGTAAAVRGLRREDLQAFWQAGYQPRNAALVVAGDLTEAQLRALATKHFGDWKGDAARPAPPAVAQAETGRILVVDRPGSPQTALRAGAVGVARSSPDYVAIEVMNGTLGGLFSSRINLNLRERNGYTYGASSGFGYRRAPGPFVVGTSVRTDVTGPAVQEIFKEIHGLRDAPVTAEELALSKDSFARSLPGLFETVSAAAGSSGQLFVHELPLDYYNRLPAQIQAVSADDVQRVAKAQLQPQRMVVVAVGDKAKIAEPLKATGLAPVEDRAVD